MPMLNCILGFSDPEGATLGLHIEITLGLQGWGDNTEGVSWPFGVGLLFEVVDLPESTSRVWF